MKLVITLLLILSPLYCLDAVAQEDVRSGVIKTSCGFLLAWNEPNNYYTLDIKGTDVRQTSNEQIHFSVDGAFLQVITPAMKNFLKDQQKPETKTILTMHRDWETNFLESQYKEKLKVESFPQKLANGEEALLWQIEVPKSAKSNVKKQTYLTLVKGEHIFMLGSAVTATISEKASHRLLLLTALSLKASDKPTSLAKIQELYKDN